LQFGSPPVVVDISGTWRNATLRRYLGQVGAGLDHGRSLAAGARPGSVDLPGSLFEKSAESSVVPDATENVVILQGDHPDVAFVS
jgi:hypothetical protein